MKKMTAKEYLENKGIKAGNPMYGLSSVLEEMLNEYAKLASESDVIHNVVDSVNFGFCKFPNDVCKKQCQDCKGEEMWGNQNLY